MTAGLTNLVLAVSLAAFAVRAAIYGVLGSFLPLAIILIVIALLLAARLSGRRAGRIAVRGWGVTLAIYGVLRLGLAGLLLVAPVSSPHAIANTGPVFMLISALYLAAGVYLAAARRDRVAPEPAS
jgi:hypothetical protein